MKRTTFIWFSLTLATFGAETVAWRIPVELVVDGGVDHPAVTRMEKPPGESSFFEEGDPLWDLSDAIEAEIEILPDVSDDDFDPFAPTETEMMKIEKASFEGGFVVWNARSGMIVARGNAAQLTYVEHAVDLERQPKQVITTFEMTAGEDAQELNIMCRSGEKATVSENGTTAHVAPNLSSNMEWIDLNLALDLSSCETPHRVNTALTLRRGRPQRVARWMSGGVNHSLHTTTQVVMAWGVPLDEVRTQELKGKVGPKRRIDDWYLDGKKVGDSLSIRILNVPRDFLDRIGDPLTNRRPLVVPEELKHLIGPGYLDAAPALAMNGVKFDDPLALAGFDPHGARLLVINTPINLDLVETMCSHGCGVPRLVELTFQGTGWLSSIVGRSGEKSEIQIGTKANSQALLAVAPNVGAGEQLLDVSFEIRSPDLGTELISAVTTLSGRTLAIGGDAENPITLKAEVLPVDEEH